MPPAVIYCRVSSVRQLKEGDGLASQETRCREYARHKGYDIVQVFRDEGVSGGMIDRPGMQAMLAFLRQHKNAGGLTVIIDDISRLARGLQAHIELRSAIGQAGGRLESPSIEFGEDSDSVLVENLLASVSQHQRQKNAEQVKNRMRARFMNGYWVFACPVGYRYERVAGHGKMLVPDEPTASIVREALEGFASGRFSSQTEVKRFMDQHGAFAKARSRSSCLQKVREVLERPLYAGVMDMPSWGLTGIQGKHQPLVSYETHRRVLERLHGPRYGIARKDMRDDFPLRGIVLCGCCERPMTAAWSKGRNGRFPYYSCQTKGCEQGRKSIRKETLEGEFSDLLDSLRPSKEVYAALREILTAAWELRRRAYGDRTALLKSELSQIERKSAQLMDRLVEADNPTLIAAYEEQVRKLHGQRIAVQEKLAGPAPVQTDFEETYRTALKFIENPIEPWVSGDLAQRRLVPKLMFGDRMLYRKNEGYRTAGIAHPFRVLRAMRDGKSGMVEPRGIEPLTSAVRLAPEGVLGVPACAARFSIRC